MAPSQLLADHNQTRRIDTVDLKYALREINSDRGNFGQGRLLFPRGSAKPQLWHLDAGGWQPSTESEAEVSFRRLNVRSWE